MFFLALGVLTLLALLFCWPLWRDRIQTSNSDSNSDSTSSSSPAIRPTLTDAAARRDAYNAALYQAFEVELLEDKTLDEATRAALLADKARQLLDDSPPSPSPAAGLIAKTGTNEVQADSQHTGLGLGAKLMAATVIVAGSVLTYWGLGTPAADQLVAAREILTLPTLAEVEGNANDPSIARLRSLTGSLRGHLQRSPDVAGSWYLLGIGELKLQSYSAAAEAFESAHKLVGADSNLDLYWLQARLLADKGKLTEATQTIARRVLGTQPNQPMVLNMLALAAYRSRDFATAVGYLNSALSNNLAEGQRELLLSGFEQARASLGIAGPTVDVSLTLEGQPPTDAVLFVIARPVGGGMPYAVVRRPIAGVPQQVRLDDAVSMNPANPLSAAAEVEIVARLSLTGRPQAGPGDWQWQSDPLRLAEADGPVVLHANLAIPAG